MLDAARNACDFVQGRSRQDLDSDRMLRFALVHALEIFGEVAASLSSDTLDHYPQVPWSDIIGMRHRLAHGYYDVNLDIVWETVQAALPPLISTLDTIARDFDDIG